MHPIWHFLNGVPHMSVPLVMGPLLVTDAAVTSSVPLLLSNGSAAAPSLAWANSPTSGFFRAAGNVIDLSLNGVAQMRFLDGSVFEMRSDTVIGWSSGAIGAGRDVELSRGAANRLDLASGDSFYAVSGALGVGVAPATTAGTITASAAFNLGAIQAATSTNKIIKKVTGLADNTATDVITVTVPNANHAATIKLTLLSSNGSTDAFESSRTAQGAVVLARTSGANVVAAVATLTLAQIATVSGGATHTLAYGVSSITGAAGATNTFTIQVTVDDSGNLGSNQVVVLAELVNAEATGITIA